MFPKAQCSILEKVITEHHCIIKIEIWLDSKAILSESQELFLAKIMSDRVFYTPSHHSLKTSISCFASLDFFSTCNPLVKLYNLTQDAIIPESEMNDNEECSKLHRFKIRNKILSLI